MTFDLFRKIPFQGFVVQVVIVLLGSATSFLGNSEIGSFGLVFLWASLVPWGALLFSESSGKDPSLFSEEWRFSVAGLIVAVLVLGSLSHVFNASRRGFTHGLSIGTVLPLVMAIPVISWFAKSYMEDLVGKDSPLIPCLGYLRGSFIVGTLMVAQVILCHFGRYDISKLLGRVLLSFNLAVALELLFSLVLEWYRPVEDNVTRWTHESRILYLLSRSSSLKKTVREFFLYQFGVDPSKSWFLRMIWRFLPIGAFFVCLLLLGLSSLEIVPSGYRAVLLRWGRPVSELSQGIHLKYPWPIDRTVLIDIGRVRRIHVGSHSPTSIDGNIYVKGVPILWTNEHGLRSESYLPVSPPADIADVVMGERVPSVSLVGADVFVEFRIVKPLAFLNSGEDGIELFRKKAERTTSRTFVKYDVDTIIGKGRREAAQKILEELKVISDSMNLGLSVEYVGIVGVHPPQIVASFFEETVSALQEKETVIQWARQAAILRMTETVGDAEIAEDLIGEISSVHGRSDEIDSVLMKSGGKVASVLGEAVSYKVIRESDEEVRYERFLSQFNIFSSAPSYYGNSLYLDVLDKTLPFRRKYLIPKDRDDMMFGLSGYSGPGKMDHRVSC